MNSRTLIIGDIHGHHEALLSVLDKARFDPVIDRLIGLGDYVDGWNQSFEVVETLMGFIREKNHHIYVLGNHDMMFRQTLSRLIQGESPDQLIRELPESYRDELRATLESYLQHSPSDWQRHLTQFFETLPYYHEESQSLFVHAGYIPKYGLRGTIDQDPDLLLKDRTMYHLAHMKYHSEQPIQFDDYQHIFIGHTPTVRHGEKKPIIKGNVINLDQGCKVGGRLSLWNLKTSEFWQVEAQ